MLSTKVLIDEQRNVFQIRLKLQKLDGLESSYANKVPPIGEPKAAATPAAAPAAAKSLLSKSFLKYSKHLNGR